MKEPSGFLESLSQQCLYSEDTVPWHAIAAKIAGTFTKVLGLRLQLTENLWTKSWPFLYLDHMSLFAGPQLQVRFLLVLVVYHWAHSSESAVVGEKRYSACHSLATIIAGVESSLEASFRQNCSLKSRRFECPHCLIPSPAYSAICTAIAFYSAKVPITFSLVYQHSGLWATHL